MRTVTYWLGIFGPAPSATTRTWTSLALTRRCWSGRTLSTVSFWRAANQAAATSEAVAAFLDRTGAAAAWRSAAPVLAAPLSALSPAGRKIAGTRGWSAES